jgi:sterol 24-C-methyltransferase
MSENTLAPERDVGPTPEGTVDRITKYYHESVGYLEGPLQGTCHFGYTHPGERFELDAALRNMEVLLGETLGLPPGSRVLDAGCGFGRVATTLSEQFGYHVIGVDLMEERLLEAVRYITEQGVESLPVVEANYCSLPLRDNSVEGVYTMETLVHAEPLESALSEFKRVLVPGGKLALFEYAVPDREKLDPIRKKITDSMVHRIGMASIGRFKHGSIQSLVEDAGFTDVRVSEISRNVWPTWRWMFWSAARESCAEVLKGKKITDKINLVAALMIWPYRHQLGYTVVEAVNKK